MDSLLQRSSSLSAVLLIFGVLVGAGSLNTTSEPAFAQSSETSTPSPTQGAATNFSDVAANYWAQPFIQALAARNIITGFPDGTFKPEQPVQRAEFAAMIQKAFNQNRIRQLEGTGFTDVPTDYWAAAAIEEAYETGFMGGFPGGDFQPAQNITKLQAIVALANGLGLTADSTLQNAIATSYLDAEAVPAYATDEVAAATQANLIVNYPNVRQLNPQQSLTRAEAAAHIHQALVRLGQVQPLASNVAATQYIVGRTAAAGQTAVTPTPSPTAANNLVAVAASNQSFSTLTSLLNATGLAESLSVRGPFTVFAPTDEAFAALPEGILEKLQQQENSEVLIQILMYHIAPGQLSASQLSAGELRTLAGRPVNVQIDPAQNQIAINDARVVQPNIQASNGIIHAVNEVLLPPNLDLSQLQ
ncbi:S-layer homology domain-containing protein [Gloeocapsopsis crepidinum LEGE 06123]|uniref:S-layer homology domain-containing protein n=1 Tax=Gloeocapsopsis crepidinum LEGE 06123 TaxID=588587 RepID=A0ABR9V122_9CHRO|nr:fasciclin domain-containing protein [Gloeocapsopsis crepidinum]MBE9193510.1 S-layer homology domain-containing protein [Gloeocapsopsis crepidinum LEGE 06123]